LRKPASFVPSLFTVLNLFSGFMSIIHASSGNIEQACLFIMYAALFDTFDGVVARFTGTSSKFGVELDSLSDLVSFGAAPSFILYKYYFYQLSGPGIALSSLILIFSAFRLAKFNVTLVGFDKNFFTGVPVPISAITISSLFLFWFDKNFNHQTSVIFLYVLTFLLPILMLSKFKYDTTPKFSLKEIKAHPVKTTLIFLIIILIIITKGDGLFPFCIFYLSTGIFRGIKNKLKKLTRRKSTNEEAEIELKNIGL
jgi:CDP-diacylglycerol---serine O-phosphatidyltransferase